MMPNPGQFDNDGSLGDQEESNEDDEQHGQSVVEQHQMPNPYHGALHHAMPSMPAPFDNNTIKQILGESRFDQMSQGFQLSNPLLMPSQHQNSATALAAANANMRNPSSIEISPTMPFQHAFYNTNIPAFSPPPAPSIQNVMHPSSPSYLTNQQQPQQQSQQTPQQQLQQQLQLQQQQQPDFISMTNPTAISNNLFGVSGDDMSTRPNIAALHAQADNDQQFILRNLLTRARHLATIPETPMMIQNASQLSLLMGQQQQQQQQQQQDHQNQLRTFNPQTTMTIGQQQQESSFGIEPPLSTTLSIANISTPDPYTSPATRGLSTMSNAGAVLLGRRPIGVMGMGGMLDSDQQSFPVKLYKMVEEEDDSVIEWLPHGRGFIVHDSMRLEREILPNFVKSGRYASFHRQLNLYGFRSMKGQFSHEYFQRGKPELLGQIKRKKRGVPKGSAGVNETNEDEDRVAALKAMSVINRNRHLLG